MELDNRVMVPKNSKTWQRRLAWLVLIGITLISVAVIAIPVWVIQPFRPQSPGGLAWSFALRRWSIFVTPLALLSALVVSWRLWRGRRRWWPRVVLVVFLIPILVAVWFSRQNHFEWMFNPLPRPVYAKSADASFVTDSDVVMAVASNGEAVAYPVRLMAYHHLVDDVVGGTPIVATY
jgi:hypothetical protein